MENLGIDGKLLLAQLINFVLFFYIFKKYIATPFLKFMNQERQNEKEKEELLNKLKKGEEGLIVKDRELRDQLKKETALVLEKAKREGAGVREQIIADAKKDAQAIKERALKEIKEEKGKLYKDVKVKVADLSIMIVEKALSDYLDMDSKKKITSHILKNLDKAISPHEN